MIGGSVVPAWRSAAWRGWAFGFGYHLAGLYWIGFSFLVQAERFAALMPFAIAGLTASLGLFFAAALPSTRLRGRVCRPRCRGLWVWRSSIMIAEWLRGHILTGFPWNILGYALTMPLPLMQWAGLLGIYVLTAITVITLATPLVVLAAKPKRPWLTILTTTIVPLAFATVYGFWQLRLHPTRSTDVRLAPCAAIVQPEGQIRPIQSAARFFCATSSYPAKEPV